jgi:hypothetical protein
MIYESKHIHSEMKYNNRLLSSEKPGLLHGLNIRQGGTKVSDTWGGFWGQ